MHRLPHFHAAHLAGCDLAAPFHAALAHHAKQLLARAHHAADGGAARRNHAVVGRLHRGVAQAHLAGAVSGLGGFPLGLAHLFRRQVLGNLRFRQRARVLDRTRPVGIGLGVFIASLGLHHRRLALQALGFGGGGHEGGQHLALASPDRPHWRSPWPGAGRSPRRPRWLPARRSHCHWHRATSPTFAVVGFSTVTVIDGLASLASPASAASHVAAPSVFSSALGWQATMLRASQSDPRSTRLDPRSREGFSFRNVHDGSLMAEGLFSGSKPPPRATYRPIQVLMRSCCRAIAPLSALSCTRRASSSSFRLAKPTL